MADVKSTLVDDPKVKVQPSKQKEEEEDEVFSGDLSQQVEEIEAFIRERPLASAGIAVGLGFILGLIYRR